MAGNITGQLIGLSKVKVACAQFAPQFGRTDANIATMVRLMRQARTDLIVFPELCTSGYEFIDRDEAVSVSLDPLNSGEFEQLKSSAYEIGAHIVFGFPERDGNKVYNACALVTPDGGVTVYRKLHLFDREKLLFDRGDAAPPVVDTTVGRLGLMICFDWVFPETARLIGLAGGQILCHPSNLVLTYCQRAMFARAVENGMFAVTCNRVGSEERVGRRLNFTGQSQILSPRGATLAAASADGTEIISADINPYDADDKFITQRNDIFEDRRPEMYLNLCR